MKIIKLSDIHYKDCEQILRSLPDWFGIESAIKQYSNDIKEMETYGFILESQIIGFICINYHNKFTAEIHVMGVYKKFHNQGIGTKLIQYIENILQLQKYEYLLVKTLSDSHQDINYEITRKFYFRNNFRPLQELKELREDNPCLLMIKKYENILLY